MGAQGLIRSAGRQLVCLILIVVGVTLAACGSGSDGCGSGADDAESAVVGLLEAVVDGAPSAAVCRYLESEESSEQASIWLTDLTTLIESAGGVSRLRIGELPGDQMGAEHRVEVRADEETIAEFAVIERGDRFTVSITGSSKTSPAGAIAPRTHGGGLSAVGIGNLLTFSGHKHRPNDPR